MLPLASKYRSTPVLPGLAQKIPEPDYYCRAIEWLHAKWAVRPYMQLHAPQAEGYSFAQAFFDRRRLAALLAESVAAGEYRFSSVRLKNITINGKSRTVYDTCLMDRIVHGAVSMMLEDAHSLLPERVYSYIKGRNRFQPIAHLSQFLRCHRRERPQVKTRGLYLLHCDVRAYGESIPVLPSSLLWEQLDTLFLKAYGRGMLPQEQALLTQMIRPNIAAPEGGDYQPLYGIPDGLPLSGLLLDLYMTPVDTLLSGVRGGFYARYSDDILFAHPDREIFLAAESQLAGTLTQIGLEPNRKKYRRTFFNAAGRAAGEIVGTSHIEFLGMKIAFDGTATLKNEKIRTVLGDMAIRARATARAAKHLPFETRGRMVCQALNEGLDYRHPHAHPYAAMLAMLTDDRRELKQMDYQLAHIVHRALLRDASVKSFRILPYRKIRREWRLKSLVYARNR